MNDETKISAKIVKFKNNVKTNQNAYANSNDNYVECPDTVHFCPDKYTCCPTADNSQTGYGCCPIENGVCCYDGINWFV